MYQGMVDRIDVNFTSVCFLDHEFNDCNANCPTSNLRTTFLRFGMRGYGSDGGCGSGGFAYATEAVLEDWSGSGTGGGGLADAVAPLDWLQYAGNVFERRSNSDPCKSDIAHVWAQETPVLTQMCLSHKWLQT